MLLTHPAKGTLALNGQTVIFSPSNTTYQLYLESDNGPVQASGRPVEVVVSGAARKVYTEPSGGLFVSPIVGTPKILQGRVKDLNDTWLTLNCGVIVNVKLPTEPGGIELARGAIEMGSLVNVVLYPGASCEVKSA